MANYRVTPQIYSSALKEILHVPEEYRPNLSLYFTSITSSSSLVLAEESVSKITCIPLESSLESSEVPTRDNIDKVQLCKRR